MNKINGHKCARKYNDSPQIVCRYLGVESDLNNCKLICV